MTGAPEELRRTVAKVISEGVRDAQYADDVADAVLAVPAIADALAAQAALERARAEFTKVPRDETPAFIHATLHGLLYPEAGK